MIDDVMKGAGLRAQGSGHRAQGKGMNQDKRVC